MNRLDFHTDGRDWPNRQSSRFVEAAGVKWHVQTLGSGPVLLLLHGTGASTHSWRNIVPFLQTHFTIVMLDLPGHGFSSMASGIGMSLPGMAAGVGALVRALGISPQIVAGHSAGAAILIRMVLDRLVSPRVLISINGALVPFGGTAAPIVSPLAKLMFLNPVAPLFFAWRAQSKDAVRQVLVGTGSAVSDADLELYQRLFQSPGHCEAALSMMARWDLLQLQADLKKLSVSTILVAGERDKAVPPADAERVSQSIADSRVIKVATAGHLAHEEQPETLAAIILEAAAAQDAAQSAVK
jgi:magnesium chelatase accessory protein